MPALPSVGFDYGTWKTAWLESMVPPEVTTGFGPNGGGTLTQDTNEKLMLKPRGGFATNSFTAN